MQLCEGVADTDDGVLGAWEALHPSLRALEWLGLKVWQLVACRSCAVWSSIDGCTRIVERPDLAWFESAAARVLQIPS